MHVTVRRHDSNGVLGLESEPQILPVIREVLQQGNRSVSQCRAGMGTASMLDFRHWSGDRPKWRVNNREK